MAAIHRKRKPPMTTDELLARRALREAEAAGVPYQPGPTTEETLLSALRAEAAALKARLGDAERKKTRLLEKFKDECEELGIEQKANNARLDVIARTLALYGSPDAQAVAPPPLKAKRLMTKEEKSAQVKARIAGKRIRPVGANWHAIKTIVTEAGGSLKVSEVCNRFAVAHADWFKNERSGYASAYGTIQAAVEHRKEAIIEDGVLVI